MLSVGELQVPFWVWSTNPVTRGIADRSPICYRNLPVNMATLLLILIQETTLFSWLVTAEVQNSQSLVSILDIHERPAQFQGSTCGTSWGFVTLPTRAIDSRYWGQGGIIFGTQVKEWGHLLLILYPVLMALSEATTDLTSMVNSDWYSALMAWVTPVGKLPTWANEGPENTDKMGSTEKFQ